MEERPTSGPRRWKPLDPHGPPPVKVKAVLPASPDCLGVRRAFFPIIDKKRGSRPLMALAPSINFSYGRETHFLSVRFGRAIQFSRSSCVTLSRVRAILTAIDDQRMREANSGPLGFYQRPRPRLQRMDREPVVASTGAQKGFRTTRLSQRCPSDRSSDHTRAHPEWIALCTIIASQNEIFFARCN